MCLPSTVWDVYAHDEEDTRRCIDTDEYDARTAAATVEDTHDQTLWH